MRLMILKPGVWNGDRYTKEFTKSLAANYDPKNGHEAPVVVSHRHYVASDEDELAHGWVQGLEVDKRGVVFAEVADMSLEVMEWIRDKKLKYCSIEWMYERASESSVDTPRLHRIALLGRNLPAVPTAKIEATPLSKNEQPEHPKKLEQIVSRLSFDESIDSAIEEAETDAIQRAASDLEPPEYTKEDDMTSNETAVPVAAALKEKEQEIVRLSAALKEKEQQEAKAASETVIAELVSKGIVLPAHKDALVALDASLDEKQQTVLRLALSQQKPVVSLGADVVAAPENTNSSDLIARIEAYKQEHKLSFDNAARALAAKEPELFSTGDLA